MKMDQPTNSDYCFLEDTDLTDDQIRETADSYLKHAREYAQRVERVPDALRRIQSLTILPFLEKYQELQHRSPILFVGAGSGRDMQMAESKEVPCIGIDTSPEMRNLARNYGVTSPYYVMDMREIAFLNHGLSGIFCETAISHIKKMEQQEVLNNFYSLLVPGGLVFLGMRLGDGRIFCVDEKTIGKRYNTSSTREEADGMIKKSGFTILNSPDYPVLNRPRMIIYLLQRPI